MQTLVIPAAQRIWQTWETAPEVVQAIDELLDRYTDQQIAANLNERGLRTGKGGVFHAYTVAKIRRKHHLKSRYERLREVRLLTAVEMAHALHISEGTVKVWHKAGLLRGYAYNDKGGYLFEPPGADAPRKSQGRPLADRRRFAEVVLQSAKEVQCEA